MASPGHDPALNGFGTHGLPRSASYSTTRNGAARPEVRGKVPDDRRLPVAGDEMEAVRGHEPVERRQLERAGQVGHLRQPCRRGEALGHPPVVLPEGAPSRSTATIVAPGPSRSASARVNAPSPAPMSAQVAGRPASGSGRVTAVAEQRDVVAVVHAQPVFWSPAATPLTVSWTSRSTRSRSGSSAGSARSRASSRTCSSESEST